MADETQTSKIYKTASDVFAREDPRSWPSAKKWVNVALVSLQGFLSPLCATIIAPGAQEVIRDFHLTSIYTPNVPVGIYVLGLGLGPLYLAPFSEMYGRRVVYLTSFFLFTVFTVGCALSPNMTGLSIMRLLAGMCGSAGPTLGGASVGDMFARKDRARAQSIYSLGPTAGPVLAPLIGAFIVNGTDGWRWCMWTVVIAASTVTICSFFFLKETCSAVIRRRLSRKSQTSDAGPSTPDDSPGLEMALKRAISRPFRLLFTAPICALMALLMSLIYGILFLFLVTLPLLFGPRSYYQLYSYRWQHGLTGLAYLGPGIGIILGLFICAKYMRRCNDFTSRLLGGGDESSSSATPECRLLFLFVGLCMVPFGLTLFAWTAHYQVHWIAPLIGTALFSTGMLMAYVSIQTYVVDVFDESAASALAAITFVRSLVSCIFAITGFQMYKSLGYAWGAMLLAFVCVAMLPIPLFLLRLGPRLHREFKD